MLFQFQVENFNRMKKFIFVLFAFQLSISFSYGTKNDTIFTRYSNGEFYTFCQIKQPYSDSITQLVVNRFVNEMCYDIRGLFEWGLKGMSLSNQADELLYFDFKATRFNKHTGVLVGIGDVVVPGITTFKNIEIETKLNIQTFQSGVSTVKLDLAAPNLFIRNLNGMFVFVPRKNNQNGYIQLITKVRFAWFFDIFVTQSRYKKIMEWRIRRVLLNIREESGKIRN